MTMPTLYATRTSLRKLSRKKLRMFFGIAPTVLLLAFIVLFSTISTSINVFVRTKILAKIEYREEVIHLSKTNSPMAWQSSPTSGNEPNDALSYQPSDLTRLRGVRHIASAQPEQSLPSTPAQTDVLVAGKSLPISGWSLIPADSARIYGATSFGYTPGQPIPIIITRNTFNYQYVDMGGQSKITLTDKEMSDQAKYQQLMPLKTKFLSDDYNRARLLGRVFRVRFGGLPQTPSIAQKSEASQNSYKQIYRQLTSTERDQLTKEQTDKLSPYWDVAKLRKGIEVEFKIVGFNEEPEATSLAIPTTAGVALYQQLYDLQRAARTKTAIPNEAFASTISGTVLASNNQLGSPQLAGFSSAPPVKDENPGSTGPGATSVALPVPGLVYRTAEKDGTKSYSEVTDLRLTPDQLGIAGITLTLDDAANRPSVQKQLAGDGYPEADSGTSLTDAVRKLRDGLAMALFYIVVVLAGINSLILISTVGRSIADSQREIGVYRALGAKKRDIAKLYIIYSTVQTALGVLIGLILGGLAIYPVAGWLTGAVHKLGFDSSLTSGALGGLDLSITRADFYHLNPIQVAIYALGLLLATVVVSLIPAWRAARISPIEAIRKAD